MSGFAATSVLVVLALACRCGSGGGSPAADAAETEAGHGGDGAETISVPGCPGSCVPGKRRCSPQGVQECLTPGEGLCPVWGPSAPCPGGSECLDGECVSSGCESFCDPGEKRCKAGGVEECEDGNGDGCWEWPGVMTACLVGEICKDGACAKLCDNDCMPGESKCGPAGGVVLCTQVDDDPCYEWGAETPCLDGKACSDGACT